MTDLTSVILLAGSLTLAIMSLILLAYIVMGNVWIKCRMMRFLSKNKAYSVMLVVEAGGQVVGKLYPLAAAIKVTDGDRTWPVPSNDLIYWAGSVPFFIVSCTDAYPVSLQPSRSDSPLNNPYVLTSLIGLIISWAQEQAWRNVQFDPEQFKKLIVYGFGGLMLIGVIELYYAYSANGVMSQLGHFLGSASADSLTNLGNLLHG